MCVRSAGEECFTADKAPIVPGTPVWLGWDYMRTGFSLGSEYIDSQNVSLQPIWTDSRRLGQTDRPSIPPCHPASPASIRYYNYILSGMGRRPPWSEFMEVVSDMFDYHRLSYSSWKLFWGVNPHAPTPIEELWLVCNSIFVFWLSFPFLKNIGLHGMNGGLFTRPLRYIFIHLSRSRALHIDLSAGEILSETL